MLGQTLDQAVALLQAGGLVAMPTETVYGLAADASNPTAVARIFAAKGRPADHPLIVHLPGADALSQWACDIPEAAWKLAQAFWPGPLTLILKRAPQVLDAVTGGQDSVGLRVPDHRLALALLRSFDAAQGHTGIGLAAPSANRFGRISPTTAAHVHAELGERVDMILDGGPCTVGIESSIVDLTSGVPRLLRPGAISAAALSEVLGEEVLIAAPTISAGGLAATSAGVDEVPRTAGSHAAHYAPRTVMELQRAEALVARCRHLLSLGRRVAVIALQSAPSTSLPGACHWQQAPGNARDYARGLYAKLRELDGGQYDVILVEQPPFDAAWAAVNNRLGRAAHGSGRDPDQ